MAIKAWEFLGVEFREDTSESYWECGIYLPEVIKGAGRIYVGRVTRERRPRGWRYTVHSHKGAFTAYARKSALQMARTFAMEHPSYR